jgi:hypothetical protein
MFNPLNAELNPICHLLALLGARILHVNRIRVKLPYYAAAKKIPFGEPTFTLTFTLQPPGVSVTHGVTVPFFTSTIGIT